MDASMDQMDGLECTCVIRAQQMPHRVRPFILARTANVTGDSGARTVGWTCCCPSQSWLCYALCAHAVAGPRGRGVGGWGAAMALRHGGKWTGATDTDAGVTRQRSLLCVWCVRSQHRPTLTLAAALPLSYALILRCTDSPILPSCTSPLNFMSDLYGGAPAVKGRASGSASAEPPVVAFPKQYPSQRLAEFAAVKHLSASLRRGQGDCWILKSKKDVRCSSKHARTGAFCRLTSRSMT